MNKKNLAKSALAVIACAFWSASAVNAAPMWTSNDDILFMKGFVAHYSQRYGTMPSEELMLQSLNCVRNHYNQAAASGLDATSSVRYSVTTCYNAFTAGLGNQGSSSSRQNTLFNSSGDSSLSTDSDGCMYYSSPSYSYGGSFSFSNC